MTLARYWHTLRHMQPVQVYGRVWFRLVKPRPDLSEAPGLRGNRGPWTLPAPREASLTGPGTFLFLGEPGSVAEIGWDGPEREKLWRYNQHYFDDLNARDAADRTAWHDSLLRDWVRGNAPGRGNGWEPYPVSLRIVNWVKWALRGNVLPAECVQSLAAQARWLSRRLEVHLQGNHLFANAKALVFAGLFFDGAEARTWLQTGFRLLQRQVPEQILADGGHFERSTMYHALALEDMLDLCNALACFDAALTAPQRELAVRWRETAGRMREWLHAMCHPDGEISFFNDASFGIAPTLGELDGYAERLGLQRAAPAAGEPRHLSHSGYARLADADAVALLDMAPIGPDYLPGHAHADTLSFELSVHGQRVLVNSGTSRYGLGEERLRQRGTAAHNTVVVAGQDSSEVWSGFRVARRARPRHVRVDLSASVQRATAAHDGYNRLPGRPMHRRSWQLEGGRLAIEDSVSAKDVPAEARFHFHPDVKVDTEPGGRRGRAVLPGGHSVDWHCEQGIAHIEPSTWHPRFGATVPNACLCIRLEQGQCRLVLQWNSVPGQ